MTRLSLRRPVAVLCALALPGVLILHVARLPMDFSFAALMDREHPEVARYFEASHRSGLGGEPIIVGGPHAVAEMIDSQMTVEEVMLESGAGRRAGRLAERARSGGIPVRLVRDDDCERVAGVRCQGIAARISYRYADLGPLLEAEAGVLVFLDGVADPHNLGAIIRSAEAVGALGVVLPSRRSATVTATVMRVSAGAAAALPVARVTNLVRALESAKKAGFWLIGLAQEAAGELGSGGGARCGLVLGAEGEGLRRLVAQNCDEIARLPMRGRVESLNVSVAAGVALYRIAAAELFDAP